MRKLLTLLILTVFFGSSLSAQNAKSTARLGSTKSTSTSLSPKKDLSTPANPQFFDRIEKSKKSEVVVVKQDGRTLLQNSAVKKSQRKVAQAPVKNPVKQAAVRKENPARKSVSVVKSTSATTAKITLNVVGDPWDDGSGFQMLLDKDHSIDLNTISFQGLYDAADYTIPEGATSDLTNLVMLLDAQASVEVPEGLYDFIFLNPDPNYGTIWTTQWYDNGELAFGDDFLFKAGFEYIFKIEFGGYVEFYPERDAALLSITLPAASPTLGNAETIGVMLANSGKQAFSSVSLSYQVNGGAVVTETYTGTVNPEERVTYTFSAKADFSAAGLHTVTAWVTYADDMNPMNNQITGRTKHVAPLSLPFSCKFDDPSDLDAYWTIIDGNEDDFSWMYNDWNPDADGGIGALQVSSQSYGAEEYLVSDPFIVPAAGEYNISFSAYAFGTESLKILYGTSPDPATMSVLADYPALATDYEWSFFVKNFTIATPGNYYFAFYYYSDYSVGSALDFDNVAIGTGTFVGIPDLAFVRTEVPGSSCELSSSATLGATVKNNGTEPVSTFTLTYKIGSKPEVSQTFTETLDLKETKTVTFTQKADFSALGDYSIVFKASTPNEVNTENNETSAAILHYAPVATLPFESDFANTADRKDWTSTVANAWGYNDYYGCTYPNGYNPLLSRCITLPVGDYRFSYTYSAGFSFFGMNFFDDFYVAYGLSGTDPSTWTPVKEYFNMYTQGNTVEDDIILYITSEGEYVVGIFPVVLGDLAVFKTSIVVLPEHDVRINRVESPTSFALQTPKYQVSGNKTFNVTVQNRGKNAENGEIELKLNNAVLATGDFNLPTATDSKTVAITASIDTFSVGPLNLQFTALTKSSSETNLTDNTVTITKFVSDSTFVWDTSGEADFFDGVGLTGAAGAFGLIFELAKEDVLTSINIGFAEVDLNDDFGIAVYPVDNDLILGTPYFTQVQKRPSGGTTIAFDVPDTELTPGKYFFEVQQLENNNIAIAYDADPEGGFYANWGDGLLEEIGADYGFGYIHVRPNFGGLHTGIAEVKMADPVLKLYPNPASEALNIRVSNQQIERISVYNASGITVYNVSGINHSEYKLNTGEWTPGFYFVTVQTNAGVRTSKFMIK